MSVTSKEDDSKGRTSRDRDYEAGPGATGTYTLDVFDEQDSGIDPVYYAKARLLNDAFQEIGMGKYQVSIQAPNPSTTYVTSDGQYTVAIMPHADQI